MGLTPFRIKLCCSFSDAFCLCSRGRFGVCVHDWSARPMPQALRKTCPHGTNTQSWRQVARRTRTSVLPCSSLYSYCLLAFNVWGLEASEHKRERGSSSLISESHAAAWECNLAQNRRKQRWNDVHFVTTLHVRTQPLKFIQICTRRAQRVHESEHAILHTNRLVGDIRISKRDGPIRSSISLPFRFKRALNQNEKVKIDPWGLRTIKQRHRRTAATLRER